MQIELQRPVADQARPAGSKTSDERRELTLLAEFMRHKSVASLADDIAGRLGVDGRGQDLIVAAGLGADRRLGSRDAGSRRTPPRSERPAQD